MPFDKGKKRKLIDNCGHERCYSCMFKNETCPVCRRQQQYDDPNGKLLIAYYYYWHIWDERESASYLNFVNHTNCEIYININHIHHYLREKNTRLMLWPTNINLANKIFEFLLNITINRASKTPSCDLRTFTKGPRSNFRWYINAFLIAIIEPVDGALVQERESVN